MGKASARKRKAADGQAFFTQAEADAVRALTHGPESARTPQAVLRAFVEGGETVVVEGYSIPPIGLGRYMLIERIKSPVLEAGGWPKMNNIQLSELLFICLQPEARSRELLAKGSDAFAAAVEEYADGIPLASLHALGAAVALRLAQAFSTILSTGQKKTTVASRSPSPETGSGGV